MVTAGEEVRVFDVNGHRAGQPEGGWPGRVVKAGPKLVTISYEGHTAVFRREEGEANDQFGHQSFETLEEADAKLRAEAAKSALRALGVDIAGRCALTTSQLEAMVRSVTEAS
jgi:hypothetical protein